MTGAPLIIIGATIIDPVDGINRCGESIFIENGRITSVGKLPETKLQPDIQIIDAAGKFAIPGLMNANVHLLGDIRMEVLLRHADHFDDLIVEAAQVALKNGLTTVFDTWGPRRYLIMARDRINVGDDVGARIFCAGNIIGFEGPFSADFIPHAASVASASLAKRINATWVENVGRHLMWMTPEDVGVEVSNYIGRGIDFVKYASNEHYWASAGAFLEFSPLVQERIVTAAHNSGLTAQAHCMSVEGLRLAIEAGCDLIQHCNITGPTAIPDATLKLLTERGTAAVVFPWTDAGLAWIRKNVTDMEWVMWQMSDVNTRLLIDAGVPLLLANDGAIFSAETREDPLYDKSWGGAPEEHSLISLANGHFNWFSAMEEKGFQGMKLLQAATINIARAYGRSNDLGSITAGKIADILLLAKNPLEAAANYRMIDTVIKEGQVIDRTNLPTRPILTRPLPDPTEEELLYKPFLSTGERMPFLPCSCR